MTATTGSEADRLAGLCPLDDMMEKSSSEGAYWGYEDAKGGLWAIRWSAAAGRVSARPFPSGRRGKPRFREAGDLEAARRVALNLAADIDGKPAAS